MWLYAIPEARYYQATLGIPGTDILLKAPTVEFARAVVKGFFALATEGYAFADLSKIEQRYGRTLQGNYPEAGPAFLRFAETYWSLKVLIGEMESENLKDGRNSCTTNLEYMFRQLERFVGVLFFPVAGPAGFGISPASRGETQRAVLQTYAPAIDVDDFIKNNPILLRDQAV